MENKQMLKKLRNDFKNFNYNNQDEMNVIQAHFISSYKRTLVIKVPFCASGLSFGVIFLGSKVGDVNLIRHEYGHRIQLKKMGVFRYIRKIFIPSITANLLDRLGKLPYDYYGSPWEAEADRLGEVRRKKPAKAWPEEACRSYRDLIKML